MTTPTKKMRYDYATMRNSEEGLPNIDGKSLDRLEQDALSLNQTNQHNVINITNQVQTAKGNNYGARHEDTAISAADLQAQILRELQEANNLAKNTHKNVKKIAKSQKPNYATNSEID